MCTTLKDKVNEELLAFIKDDNSERRAALQITRLFIRDQSCCNFNRLRRFVRLLSGKRFDGWTNGF